MIQKTCHPSKEDLSVQSFVGHRLNKLCLVTQSYLTLCDPMDYSLPGTSVHGDSPGKKTRAGCHTLLQRIFRTQVSHIAGGLFTVWATREAQTKLEFSELGEDLSERLYSINIMFFGFFFLYIRISLFKVWLAASASPRSLWDIQNLRPHFQSFESNSAF